MTFDISTDVYGNPKIPCLHCARNSICKYKEELFELLDKGDLDDVLVSDLNGFKKSTSNPLTFYGGIDCKEFQDDRS